MQTLEGGFQPAATLCTATDHCEVAHEEHSVVHREKRHIRYCWSENTGLMKMKGGEVQDTGQHRSGVPLFGPKEDVSVLISRRYRQGSTI